MSAAVEPTELVAGAWQLRPWPAAYADLDDVLAEQGLDAEALRVQRQARLDGWGRGDLLGFAVREITTGAAVGEVLARVSGGRALLTSSVRPGRPPVPETADAVRRWLVGALGLDVD